MTNPQPTGNIYPYFSKAEITCKCGCGKAAMHPQFMWKLVELRRRLGPLVLTSAYRCPSHNAKVSSTGLSGPHTTGRAVDIKADSRLRYKIIKEASSLGFTRFGIAKSFIHIDDLTKDDGFDVDVIWVY